MKILEKVFKCLHTVLEPKLYHFISVLSLLCVLSVWQREPLVLNLCVLVLLVFVVFVVVYGDWECVCVMLTSSWTTSHIRHICTVSLCCVFACVCWGRTHVNKCTHTYCMRNVCTLYVWTCAPQVAVCVSLWSCTDYTGRVVHLEEEEKGEMEHCTAKDVRYGGCEALSRTRTHTNTLTNTLTNTQATAHKHIHTTNSSDNNIARQIGMGYGQFSMIVMVWTERFSILALVYHCACIIQINFH